MNVMLWFLAGGALGWITCAAFNLNTARGLVISALIGMAGAFFGGHVLTTAFGWSLQEGATGFNPFALAMAAATAIACLKVADMLHDRFGF